MNRAIRPLTSATLPCLGALALAVTACAPSLAGSYTAVWSENLDFGNGDTEQSEFDTAVSVTPGDGNAVTLAFGDNGACRIVGTLNGTTATIAAGQTCTVSVPQSDGTSSSYAYTFGSGTADFSSTTTYTPRGVAVTTTCRPRRSCRSTARQIVSSSTTLYVRLTLTATIVQTVGADTYSGTGMLTINGGRGG